MTTTKVKVWHDYEQILLEENTEASSESNFEHPLTWRLGLEYVDGVALMNAELKNQQIGIKYTTTDKSGIYYLAINESWTIYHFQEPYGSKFNKPLKPAFVEIQINDKVLNVHWV